MTNCILVLNGMITSSHFTYPLKVTTRPRKASIICQVRTKNEQVSLCEEVAYCSYEKTEGGAIIPICDGAGD